MQVNKLGVVGAGTMGNGIAQLAAVIGCDVIMRDINDDFVERGIKNIDNFLSKSVEKGKLQADEKVAIMGRIKGTTDVSDLKDVDFVISSKRMKKLQLWAESRVLPTYRISKMWILLLRRSLKIWI